MTWFAYSSIFRVDIECGTWSYTQKFNDTKLHKEIMKIRMGMRGGGSVTLNNLTNEEVQKIEATVTGGAWWMTIVEGRAVFTPRFKALPDPIDDAEMLPFWRKVTPEVRANATHELFEHEVTNPHSVSLSIQHLCAYNYTPEGYVAEAAKLESYGFECMRTRRSDLDGKYYEIWFLSGLWAAKGPLQSEIHDLSDEKAKLARAIKFLQYHVSFGSMDMSVQRLAMVAPD